MVNDQTNLEILLFKDLKLLIEKHTPMAQTINKKLTNYHNIENTFNNLNDFKTDKLILHLNKIQKQVLETKKEENDELKNNIVTKEEMSLNMPCQSDFKVLMDKIDNNYQQISKLQIKSNQYETNLLSFIIEYIKKNKTSEIEYSGNKIKEEEGFYN